MIKKCRKCQHPYKNSDMFCANCGATRPAADQEPAKSRNCSRCGAKIPETAFFCGSCGGPVPATQTPAAPSVKNRTRKPSFKLIIILTVIVIVTVAFLMSPVLGILQMKSRAASADKIFKEGIFLEQTLPNQKKTTMGSVDETGWALTISQGAFPADTDLTMMVKSYDESDHLAQSDGNVVGTPVEIIASSDNRAIVYLNKPMSISMQIPSRVNFSKQDMDRYVAACLYDDKWFYVHPKAVDLANGVVTFETDHLTNFAVISLDDKVLIEKLAADYAKREWSRGNTKEQVMTRLKTTIQDALSDVGIKDRAQQEDIILSIKKTGKYDELVTDIENGKKVDLNRICSEMTADVIMAKYVDFPGSALIPGLDSTTSLAKGTAELERGNYKNAAGHYVKALAQAYPPTNMINSAIEGIQFAGILARDWDRFSESIAFKVYCENIEHKGSAHSITSPEWIRVLTELYGSMDKAEAAALAENSRQSGKPVSELKKDPTLVQKIFDDFSKNLKDRYTERYTLERDLEKQQAANVKLVQGMMKAGLLARGSLAYGFDMDIRDRIDQLFVGRAYILDLFGGKMPVLAMGESQEQNLNEALSYLLTCRGDNAEFIRWLKEKGYKPAEGKPAETSHAKPTSAPSPTPSPTPAATEGTTAAAGPVELDPDSDTVPVVSSGNFVCRTWINTSMDYFAVDGGTLTGAGWSYSRGYRGYQLTGTCKAGESVSLSIAATMGAMGYQMQHQGNDLVMQLKVYDTSGKEIESATQKIEIIKSGSQSLADVVLIAVPDNASKVTMSGAFDCNWVTPGTSASETVAVSVTFSVVNE